MIRKIDEYVGHAGSFQAADRLGDYMVEVQNGVVIGVVQLLRRAATGDVGVVARGPELQEFGGMPVGVQRTVTAASEVHHHEPISRLVTGERPIQQRNDVLVE